MAAETDPPREERDLQGGRVVITMLDLKVAQDGADADSHSKELHSTAPGQRPVEHSY